MVLKPPLHQVVQSLQQESVAFGYGKHYGKRDMKSNCWWMEQVMQHVMNSFIGSFNHGDLKKWASCLADIFYGYISEQKKLNAYWKLTGPQSLLVWDLHVTINMWQGLGAVCGCTTTLLSRWGCKPCSWLASIYVYPTSFHGSINQLVTAATPKHM